MLHGDAYIFGHQIGTVNMDRCYGSQISRAPRGGGGTCQNFEWDARPIFLGLKFGQILFFWVGKFFSYFSGFRKISAIFLGLTNFQLFCWVFQFLYHTLESFKWRTHSTEKHKIIVAFHVYSDFDKHCILGHSIFLGLNFGAFYFFGVWI